MKEKPTITDEAKAKLDAFNATQADWYGVCRKCGEKLSGTPADLAAHRCKDGSA